MDPLYDELLHHDFEDSTSAVEFCRNLAFNAGFTVKQEASANRVSLAIVMILYFGVSIGLLCKHLAPLLLFSFTAHGFFFLKRLPELVERFSFSFFLPENFILTYTSVTLLLLSTLHSSIISC